MWWFSVIMLLRVGRYVDWEMGCINGGGGGWGGGGDF